MKHVAFAVLFLLAATLPLTAQEAVLQHKIIVDGKPTVGIYRKDAQGLVQVFTCPEPKQWATPDRTEHGWACYEALAEVWIMNALPPVSPTLVQPQAPCQDSAKPAATVVVQQPEPEIVYVPYDRPVIPGRGEVIFVQTRPVRSSRVVITRDAIRTTGRVLSSVYGGRRGRYGRY